MSKQIISLALATTALTSAVPALAQDRDGTANEAIVVTARRVEERLQDVPISITVFNQQELSDRNVVNAQDLATYTPSLAVTTNFGSDGSTFAIRGFVQETGTAPSVGVYFADVVAPRGGSAGFPAGDGAGPGSFFDLQNVQVLKGPQGTLFGRNTTGGAVLLVPNRPTDELEGYVEGSIGNYDMRRVEAVLNVPLAETFKVRLGIDRQKRDGYLKNVSGIGPNDYADVDYIAVRGSVIAELTPDLENYTIASYGKSSTNGFLQKLFVCNPSLAQTNFLGQLACGQLANQDLSKFYDVQSDMEDAFAQTQQWQVINTTTWQATDNLTIKNIISFAEHKTRQRSNLFGSNFVVPQGALGTVDVGGGTMMPFPFSNTPIGFASIRHIPTGDTSDQTTFTEEFRLEGVSFDGALNWQAGAYYEDATPNAFVGSQSPSFIGCSDPDNFVCTDLFGSGGINYTVVRNTFKTRGLYAQGTYALNDQFKVTGGFRYTWDKIRSVSRRFTYTFPRGVPDASPNPLAPFDGTVDPLTGPAVSYCTDFLVRELPQCQLDQKVSFSKPTWILGLDYNPTPDVLLYGKYSRGYRAGGIKSDVPTAFAYFDPEKVDTFEVGAKTSFSGAVSGYFNIAAFYNDFSNQQLQLGFNPNLNRRDAAGNPLPAIPVTSTAGPVNVGKSRIWGIELDAQLRPFEGMVLSGAYTYLNTEVREVTQVSLPSDDPYVVSGYPPAGVPLILAPKHKFTMTASYTLPLDESVGDISLAATYIHIGSQVTNYDDRHLAALNVPLFPTSFTGVDTGKLPPTNLVNLNLNWDSIGGSPIDLSAFITNLTKEKYYTSIPALLPAVGFSSGSVGEPRMYGVRLRYSFGR